MSKILVPPEGPKEAKICILGEAPGKVELKQGRPFCGPSGRTLDLLLRNAGIKRHECYVTNVIKTDKINIREYYEDAGLNHPTDELRRIREEVIEEINSVGPNLTIALGAEALKCLHQDDDVSIGNYRGSILRTPVGKVIPSYHPAAMLRQWEWFPIASLDFAKVLREKHSPEVNLKDRKFITEPTIHDVRRYIREVVLHAPQVAFDIETVGRGHRFIDCLAIAPADGEAMCIPFTYRNGEPYWRSVDDEMEAWTLVGEVLSNPKIKKIGQNGQYDIIYLERFGIPIENYHFDTMAAANVLHPEFPKALAFLASIYTDEPFYKDTSQSDRWIYNAKDACLTFEVAEKQQKDLKDRGLEEFYFNHVHPLLQIYIEIHENGVKIDTIRLQEAKEVIEQEIEQLSAELSRMVGWEVNVNSPKQMKQLLYDEMKFPLRKNKSGNPTADAQAIKEFYRRSQRRELELILEIRKKRKVLSTYLNMPYDSDGRVRTSYNVSGTETGRLSSSSSVDGTGTNMQNLPKGICREILVPDTDDDVFVAADLGQAENRVVAYLCCDPQMKKVVDSEGDIHTTNAAMIFNKPEEEVTPAERQLGKRITHGSNYRMSWMTFSRYAEIPAKDAKRLLQQYHDTYPFLSRWHREIELALRKDRTLRNPFGRERIFYGRMDDATFRDATAYLPQSTVSDAIHAATFRIYARLPHPARIALQLHDSITVHCPRSMQEEAERIIVEELQRPFYINGQPLEIPADVNWGTNWNECG